MILLPFLHFFCIIIYLYLGFYVLYKDPGSTANRFFAIFLFCFSLFNLPDVFAHNPNPQISVETAMLLQNISVIGWGSFASVLLCFAMAFSKKEHVLRSKVFIAACTFMPALCIYKQWTNSLLSSIVRRTYGYEYIWSNNIWVFLFYLYYISYTLAAIYIIYKYGKATNVINEKKEVKIITVSIVVSLIIGTILDIVIPQLFNRDIPPIGNATLLIFAAGVVYAIIRYRFLTVSPAVAIENIVSIMSECVVLTNLQNEIVYANKATLELLGYKESALRKKPLGKIFAEGVKGVRLKEIIEGTDAKKYDCFAKTANDRRIPVILSSMTVRRETFGIAGRVYMAEDISEKKKAEEEKQKIEAQLIQSEKMAAVGLLASGVAHEINNPLAGILGIAQILLRETPGENPLYKDLKMIEQSVHRCKNIISGLLAFGHQQATHVERVNINGVIDDMLALFGKQIEIENIRVMKDLVEVPQIIGDSNQLSQVFLNLFMNARDAMKPGGVISIATRDCNDHIEITITDTGCGITQEIQNKIFEPFFSTKEVGSGTGLGLSICLGIIEKHKGTINISSEPGKGTAVTVMLPTMPFTSADSSEPEGGRLTWSH